MKTGEIIVRRKWDELPIPTDVIERLKELTTDGAEYEDGPDKEQENEEEQQLVAPENDLNWSDGLEDERCKENVRNSDTSGDHERELEQIDEDQLDCVEESNKEENINDLEEEQPEQDVPEKRHRYNVRNKRDRDYSYRFAMVSVKTGLERWGSKMKDALLDELNLFIDQKVFEQVMNPTESQKKAALWVHCFMTEKQDGKSRHGVADGQSQKRYLEEQTYSPTVKLEKYNVV